MGIVILGKLRFQYSSKMRTWNSNNIFLKDEDYASHSLGFRTNVFPIIQVN